MSQVLNLSAFSRVQFVDPNTGFLTREAVRQVIVLQDRVGGMTTLSAVDVANVPAGGIAATNVQAAIDELDSEKQPKDATLTAFSGVTTAADTLVYATGVDAFTTTPLTTFARTILDDPDAATVRTTIGAGTVTTLSVVSANGFAGTVATAGTTPAITLTTTLTGLLKGNGTAMSAATAGTDYLAPPAGTALLKANAGGALANAVAGTDYVAPGGALGTPSSGTLTNCTGLPNTGVTGLGSMSTQSAASVAITGGAIDGTPIGATTQSTGRFTTVRTNSATVATLPAAATAGQGARSFVTDATATTFLSIVAGGGANKVPVVSDGANWLIG